MNVVQRGIAGAEVVNGDTETMLLELAEFAQCFANVFQHDRFGEFKQQVLRRDAVLARHFQQVLDEIRQFEVFDGNVDRDVIKQVGLLPFLHLLERHFKKEFAQVDDQVAGFGHRNEFAGRDHAATRVFPACQRLRSDDVHVGQADDRLIGEEEVLFCGQQAAPHFAVELYLFLQRLVHVLVENQETVEAMALRSVHRGIRTADQADGIVAVFGVDRHADTGTDAQEVPADDHRPTGQLLQEIVGKAADSFRSCFNRGASIKLGHQHGEFVTPHARHQVVAGEDGFQQNGNLLQYQIADFVAQRVVDVLEILQIHEDQREGTLAFLVFDDQILDALHEHAPVGQVGQQIDIGESVQFVFQIFPAGDVGHDQQQILVRRGVGIVVVVGDHFQLEVDEDFFLALPPDGDVTSGWGRDFGLCPVESGQQLLRVKAEQFGKAGDTDAQELVGVVTAQAGGGLIDENHVHFGIKQQESLLRLFDDA